MPSGGAVYHGHDGLRQLFSDFEEAWGDQFRVEPEAYFDLGEHTLSFYVAQGRGRRSGAEVEMPAAAGVQVAGGPLHLLQGIRAQRGRA